MVREREDESVFFFFLIFRSNNFVFTSKFRLEIGLKESIVRIVDARLLVFGQIGIRVLYSNGLCFR